MPDIYTIIRKWVQIFPTDKWPFFANADKWLDPKSHEIKDLALFDRKVSEVSQNA